MLAEGIAARRGRYGAYLFRDRINASAASPARRAAGGDHQRRGHSRERSVHRGLQPEGVVVGTVDEDFAVESNRGDIMLLGNTSWMIHRIETTAGRVIVEDAHGAPPSVPFWRGEAPARTAELVRACRRLARKDQRDVAQHFAGRIFGEPSAEVRRGGFLRSNGRSAGSTMPPPSS